MSHAFDNFMITGWGVGWYTCGPKMMVTQQSGIETWRLSVCMPSKVIVNFIACMHFKNAKVKVHDSWMSPNEITLLAARLLYIYIAMVSVCFVFGCVWMFFLSDAEAVTERIRNFWGKGALAKQAWMGTYLSGICKWLVMNLRTLSPRKVLYSDKRTGGQ